MFVRQLRSGVHRVLMVVLILAGGMPAVAAPDAIGNYRVFETAVTNRKNYDNKFTDVELLAEYTAPSGKKLQFWGFFDGNGKGGGDISTGNVWKLPRIFCMVEIPFKV